MNEVRRGLGSGLRTHGEVSAQRAGGSQTQVGSERREVAQ